MVREATIAPEHLIAPLFVTAANTARRAIDSMPGIFQWPVENVASEAERLAELGVKSLILFGIPKHKDDRGTDSYDENGVVQCALREIKRAVPELVIVTDVCLCEYTDHGHCGIVNGTAGMHNPHLPDGYLLNDESVELLARIAQSHVDAGADVVAPSAMLDGMVAAIRDELDQCGALHVPIMSYSVKYASSYYGPFREAAQGTPKFGDRSTHQMDPANAREAIREHAQDIAEGADFLMVKPALAYLDILRITRDEFPNMPLVAYNVSGEFAMLKAAAANGWLDERGAVMETLVAMRRAGADLVITYHAQDAVRWIRG